LEIEHKVFQTKLKRKVVIHLYERFKNNQVLMYLNICKKSNYFLLNNFSYTVVILNNINSGLAVDRGNLKHSTILFNT